MITLLCVIVGGVHGIHLAMMGYTLTTWQFWFSMAIGVAMYSIGIMRGSVR